MQIRSEDSWTLEVYPILSFSESVMGPPLSDTAKALLLPLSDRRPTPDAFGPPLDLGNWSTNTSMRDSFLHVIPKRFVMPTSRPFKRMNPPLSMSSSMLYRIDRYRETLNSYTLNTHNHDNQSPPSPNGGGGNGQGNPNPRHGQTRDGGGHVASVASVTSSPTIIGDGEGEKEAGAGPEQLSVKFSDGPLVLEGVDEDAQDADATTLEELMMLAHDDPIWMEELRKYLKILEKEKEQMQKEKEQMQKERAVRLAHWREGVVVQPT